MIINNNLMAMNTKRQLGKAKRSGAKSLEKLSSGKRINRAGDDAAGLSISEKMRGQIRGLNQASRNAQDGISLVQTAEGALNETHEILQRMRELSIQAANDTNNQEDREAMQKEIDQLATEITRIGKNTEYNTQELLTGGFAGHLHIGANDGQNLALSISNMRAAALGVEGMGFPNDFEMADLGAVDEFTIDAESVKQGMGEYGGFEENEARVAGEFNFDISVNPAENDKITIDGQTFVFEENANIGNELEVQLSEDADETAGNLRTAIANHSTLGIKYEVTGDGASIEITEKNVSGDTFTAGNLVSVDGEDTIEINLLGDKNSVLGKYSFDITEVFSDGDEIKILGNSYIYQSDGSGDFDGVGVTQQAESLAAAIESIDAFYLATNTNGKVELSESAGIGETEDKLVNGDIDITQVDEELGVYSFEVTENFALDVTIEIGGETFTAVAAGEENTGSHFAMGDTIEETVSNLRESINANTALADRFEIVEDNGAEIILKEKAGAATGTDLNKPIVNTAQALRSFSFGIREKGEDSQRFHIQGQDIFVFINQEDVDAHIQKHGSGTAMLESDNLQEQMENLKNAILANSELQFDVELEYESAESVARFTLTQQIADGSMDDITVEFPGEGGPDITSKEGVDAAIVAIGEAIETVSSQRSELGAIQNRLAHTISNLDNSAENLQAAESRIRDVDMAAEMMEMTKQNILQQASVTMLAQANNAPQTVLQLLG